MNEPSCGRRAALAALSAWALVAALPALAQDPRQSAAQAAALKWLELADAGDATLTYGSGAMRFRESLTAAQWTEALAAARARFGTFKRRSLASARVPEPGKNTPPGEFMILMFRTEFANRADVVETLTLEREPDGVWRVVGYLMR